MDPSPEPPPLDPNPKADTPSEIPPDVPSHRAVYSPTFPKPDPIRAVPENYFPDKEQLSAYTGQLQNGLQMLVQGSLDYCLTGFLSTWKGTDLGVEQREFETAARLAITTLNPGPRVTTENSVPLRARDWGSLASACLAAIARGFTRPLVEKSRKAYTNFWESLDDIPQHILEEGENPDLHSFTPSYSG